MEWVETTGRNIEEAKRFALEQLGVAEADAEVEVLSEPKMGLFGRLKEEARVRARVRPRYPRAKGERRERRHHRAGQPDNAQPAAEAPALGSGSGAGAGTDDEGGPKGTGADGEGTGHRAPARRRPRRPAPAKPVAVDEVPDGALATASVPAEEQLRHAHEFLEGLILQLGVAATVTSHPVTDDMVEFLIQGEDIGALIGPGVQRCLPYRN